MSESRWKRLQSLFARAVVLEDEERQAFLSQACKDDPDLRRELEALLEADSDPDRLTSFALDAGFGQQLDDQLVGTAIGAWEIVERIGAGGMGSVFLARRVDGSYEQDVALKVVKKGMDTERIVRRFEMERQILARLEHPNIARLIDGGVTHDGRPYLAMEYVDGLPIREYCDRNKLNLDQRIRLFRIACNAVHHAHRSLIVHRDLKPSNIIVTADGVPKLLDFGIAKLLDDTGEQDLTRTGRPLHTPAYAAPEQLADGAITTATDVYALGVILYELLSGRRPFEVRRTPREFRERVLSDGPARPSTVITQTPADTDGHAETTAAEELGRLRRTPVERLRRQLKGDLDTICLMALRKEPEGRYASADQMAADLGRHLEGLPVVARPDSMTYRAGKFFRRHRLGTGVTIAVVLAFAGLTSFYTARLAAERDLALYEQRKAAEVIDFVTGLFAVSHPEEARGKSVSARELLDAGAERIRTELEGRPGVQANMMRVLGEVYHSLGVPAEAEALLADALDRQTGIYGQQHAEVASSKLMLGIVYQDASRYEEADALFEQALETRRRLFGEPHREVMEALSVRAYFEETIGNYERARQLHENALAMGRALFSADDEFLAEAMVKLAGIYRILDRLEEAEPLLREALAIREESFDLGHRLILELKSGLGATLSGKGEHAEATVLLLEAYEGFLESRGAEHKGTRAAARRLVHLYERLGDEVNAARYRETPASE